MGIEARARADTRIPMQKGVVVCICMRQKVKGLVSCTLHVHCITTFTRGSLSLPALTCFE